MLGLFLFVSYDLIMTFETNLNLTNTDGRTTALDVEGFNRINVDIILTGTFTWGSGVVEMKWSNAIGVDEDTQAIEQWNSFTTAVTLSSGTTSILNQSLRNASYIQFHTTTANASGDPAAIVTVEVS